MPDSTVFSVANNSTVVRDEKGTPAIRCYILTAAGEALSRILPNQRVEAFHKLIEALRAEQPQTDWRAHAFDKGTGLFNEVTIELEPE